MKIRNRPISLGLLLIVVAAIGCEVPVFKHSLIDPNDAKTPREILGSYVTDPETPQVQPEEIFALEKTDNSHDKEYHHIGLAGDNYPKGFIRIVRVNVPTGDTGKIEHSSIVGFTKRLGDKLILHIPVHMDRPVQEGDYEANWDPSKFDGYLIAVLNPTKAGMELRMINSDFIISEIKSGRLKGRYVPNSSPNDTQASEDSTQPPEFTVSAKPNKLIQFFRKNVDGGLLLEKEPTLFRKIK